MKPGSMRKALLATAGAACLTATLAALPRATRADEPSALTAGKSYPGLVVPEQTDGKLPAGYQQAPSDVIARGKYLTDLGDCEGCHDANNGRSLAGGQYMGMPFGDLSTPNITGDVDTGIGKYTDAHFIRLMRKGITNSGQYIYPAMPYPWYATLEDKDLLAIKAYLFSIAPVHAPRRPNKVWFPFNIRPAVALWDLFFVPDARFKPDPKLSDAENHGAWIVGGLEHCGECHNNRNFLGNTSLALFVQGGPITRWYAPNLTADKQNGLGGYSDDALYHFLRDGHSTDMGTVAGPMAEVIDLSMKKIPESDVHDIVSYLRTIPAVSSYAPYPHAPAGNLFRAGEQVYLDHCESCHQVDGRGIANKVPALDGNGMVRAYGSQDVIRVVLGGLEARGPFAPMPGVGAAMTDKEVSEVANYVRQAWSNRAPANATDLLVQWLRLDTHTFMNGERPGGCPPLANLALQKVLDDKSNGIADMIDHMTLPTMLQTTDAIVAKLHGAAPTMEQADIVNGLMLAYCPVVENDPSLNSKTRFWQMTHFAERVYVQLTTNGAQ